MTKSTGRQQEREERARRIISGNFDEILRLVESGVPMVKACRYVPGQPTVNAIRHWMRKNPDQWERFKEAQRKAYGSTGFSPYTPAAWESALVTIATADEAMSQINRQGEPNYDACLKRAARDPAFRIRFDAALAERNSRPNRRPARFGADAYATALDVIRSNPDISMGVLNAELVRRRLPKLGAIYSAKYVKPEIARKFAEISEARGVHRYSDEAYAEALEILSANPRNARSRLKAASGRLPSFNAIKSKSVTSPVVAALFEDYRVRSRASRAQRRQAKRERVVYRDGVLRSGLLLDDLYREASALFHGGIPDRDDLITEVVLAVLEGELPRDDIKKRGKAVGFASMKGHGTKRTDSLDRPISRDGSGATMGEMMSSDYWSLEDAV